MCWAPVFQQVGKVLCSAKCVYPTQHHKQTADIIMNNIEISWIDTLIVLDIWYDCVLCNIYILQELSIYWDGINLIIISVEELPLFFIE